MKETFLIVLAVIAVVAISIEIYICLHSGKPVSLKISDKEAKALHISRDRVREEKSRLEKQIRRIIESKSKRQSTGVDTTAARPEELPVPRTPEEVMALGEMLESGNESIYKAAMGVLMKVRDPKLVPALLVLFRRCSDNLGSYDDILELERTDIFQRRYETAKYFAMTLGEIKDPQAIPALLGNLGKLEGAESWALAKYGKSVLPELLRQTNEAKDKWAREMACRAISEMEDPQAKDDLLGIFKGEKNANARGAAGRALLQMNDEKMLQEVVDGFSMESDETVLLFLHLIFLLKWSGQKGPP